MKNHYDVIVAGLGAMGSSSAYQLARRGCRVLAIDRYYPPHSNGSSHGRARVMRLAIGEGEHYTPLSKRSYELFRELETRTGNRLLEVTGMLTISAIDRSVIQTEGHFFDNTVQSARKHDIPHDLLDARQVRARFPQFKIEDDQRAYFEYDAGYLRPEECVRTQLSIAQQLGCHLHLNEQVKRVFATESGAGVETNQDTYYAASVVLTAGPWLAELLEHSYAPLFQPFRQVQYYFDTSGVSDQFSCGAFPIFFWQLPGADNWMYGFPALDGLDALSLGVPNRTPPVTPATIDRSINDSTITAVYENYVSRYFHNVSDRCIKAETCLYTATPDGEFVIDRHPSSKHIIVCSPCSGHGFKHSAAIGEAVAELICNEPTIDLSAFKLKRF